MKRMLIPLLPFMAGCATIFSGSQQDVAIQAPSDATVEIAKMQNSAPIYNGAGGAIKLDTGSNYIVTVKRQGSANLVLKLDHHINGVTFVNFLFIFPVFMGVGFAIDLFSGATWTLPGNLFVAFPTAPIIPINGNPKEDTASHTNISAVGY